MAMRLYGEVQLVILNWIQKFSSLHKPEGFAEYYGPLLLFRYSIVGSASAKEPYEQKECKIDV